MTQERPVQPLDNPNRRQTDKEPSSQESQPAQVPQGDRPPEDSEQGAEETHKLLAGHPVGVLKASAGTAANVPQPSQPSGAPD